VKPVSHILVSGIISSAFYFYSKSIIASSVCFLSGVIIDIDHILDYYLHYRSFKKGFSHFYNSCLALKIDRLHLVLHSYELVLILWVLVFVFRQNLLFLAISVGMSGHLLLDQVGNDLDRLGYFFIFRLLNNFKIQRIIKR
jgi:uncharacterized membrane protein YjjP (DUF1212 family)